MLELHEADGAFERLEEWLRGQGFFAPGGEELVADLYLGYGLSSTIRRDHDACAARAVPAATRCLLPSEPTTMLSTMTTRGVVATTTARRATRRLATDLGAASTTRPRSRACATRSRRGDVYQVNLVQHLSAPFSGAPRRARRPPRAADTTERAAVHDATGACSTATAGRSSPPHPSSSSRGAADRVWTCPIKGTRPARPRRPSSRDSAKDAAEHVMIVDLERNDLSRVCEPGQRALAAS